MWHVKLGRVVVVTLLGALAVVGCSTGSDAVAQGGTFEFVSPGGKTDLFYDPPQVRGTVGALPARICATIGPYPCRISRARLW